MVNEVGEIDDTFITTGIDRFIRLLHQKRRIKLNDASKELDISPDTIEYWSCILETNGLVKIVYSLTAIHIEWTGT